MRVALSGKARAGKTSLAKLLEERLHYLWISLASPIKDIVHTVYDEPIHKSDKVYLEHSQKWVSYRELYILVGTALRGIDPDIWVKYMLKAFNWDSSFVVDDMRFRNEYEALVKAGFLTVRIQVSEEIRNKRIEALGENPNEAWLTGETETDLDSIPDTHFDIVLNGDKPIEGVYNDLCTALASRLYKPLLSPDEYIRLSKGNFY